MDSALGATPRAPPEHGQEQEQEQGHDGVETGEGGSSATSGEGLYMDPSCDFLQ